MRQLQYRPGEAAERLDISVDHLRRLADRGAIKATRTRGGHRRFSERALAAYEAKRRGGDGHRRSTVKGKARPPRRRPYIPIFDDDPEETEYLDPPVPPDEEADEENWPEVGGPEELVPEPPQRLAGPGADRSIAPSTPTASPDSVADTVQRERAAAENAREEATRVQQLKNHGMASIPYDLPLAWRAKVVEELERRVTGEGVPVWVPDNQQRDLARGIVEAVVKRYRDDVAQEEARKQAEAAREKAREEAKEKVERRVKDLITHGVKYADDETRQWDISAKYDARGEVGEALKLKVKADWTEQEVQDLVDELLDKWEEEEDE